MSRNQIEWIMRKLFVFIALMCGMTAVAKDEFEYGVFNHLGASVSAGTTGVGVHVSTCVTKWLGVRAGVNIMPGIKINTDVGINQSYQFQGETVTFSNVNVEGNLARTTFDVIADVYPFGGGFFVSAGFSFGGADLVKVKGHSDEVAEFYRTHDVSQYQVQIDDLNIPVDKNGNVEGGVKVSAFRPYLGIGFGSRNVPKRRLGFRTDLGVQIDGKPKVYGGGKEDLLDGADIDGADDISKFVNKLTVYPVLRFTLTGRIL